jgi:spoIIIJ-associated protein
MNGFLIGQNGETLRAMQFTVSNALRNNEYEYSRVNIDIADYKKHRADELSERALGWVEKVKSSGEQFELRPMNPADRRIVHKVAGDHGLETESIGFGRDRHIIIKAPAASEAEVTEPKETKEQAVDEKE